MSNKRRIKKPRILEYLPEALASINAEAESSSSAITQETEPATTSFIQSTRYRALPDGTFQVTNPVITTSVGFRAQPIAEDLHDSADNANLLPWSDIMSLGTELEDFPSRLESGDLPLEFYQDHGAQSTGDEAMREWEKHIDGYLHAILTHEGVGTGVPEYCPRCFNKSQSMYRCLSCYLSPLLCGTCIVEGHRQLPLHRIQLWNGTFFEKTWLKTVGLRIQLGHGPRDPCPYPVKPRDANFRLKRKDVSNDRADPGLSHGFAYFVDESKFQAFLEERMDEVEPKSTCSRHDAVNLADTRPGMGFATTGVATVECARHNMKRPSGVGDLQRGERYCNIDYLVNQSLAGSNLTTFIVSYDICCQWSINCAKRLKAINPELCLIQPAANIRYVVPKFHLPAHIAACRTRYAFMLTHGAGLGDGEAPERGWGNSNPLATSTREMGPGTRRDTLDYNFGDYNWKKITHLDKYLLGKMTAATAELPEQTHAFCELEEVVDQALLVSWRAMFEAWERDSTKPNPFEEQVQRPTQASIRLKLADAEEQEILAQTKEFHLDQETSPSSLIGMALDIESDQRSLKLSAGDVWEHSGDRQLARVKLQSNSLRRKIEYYYGKVHLYIPATATLRRNLGSGKTTPPHLLPLWLPSQLGGKVPFDPDLARLEFDMREAQAYDALVTMRRQLQVRATLYDSKDRWIRGQRANTRARGSIGSTQKYINLARDEYRAARNALVALSQFLSKPLDASLQVLKDSDVRSMHSKVTDREEAARLFALSKTLRPLEDGDIRPIHESAQDTPGITGETRKELSWIWRVGDITSGEEGSYDDDAIRVEWAKSKARAARYAEEIQIVEEEMARTLGFLTGRQTCGRNKLVARRIEGLSRLSLVKRWQDVQTMIGNARKLAGDRELWYNQVEEEETAKEKVRLQRLGNRVLAMK
ncbi:hypothetical protein EST38_g11557 [Candolleomyces aberdarensis]|uniref:CxC2-like cysteine cluster KDZ transposase-associated domain-containing protein n=1 Tax=Candolleomyces aberdarensis TaxID=2316362 RepID=A0A4Q2D7V5_9AGAR|nr:hypothetical protein EST38_g11557 [Candolleomyces aberdarensis]